MTCVAFHGLDEIGDEVMALTELHIDIGESLVPALIEADDAIIDPDYKQNDDDGDDQEND
jgi:hypothetical protein